MSDVLWKRYCEYFWADDALGVSLDISRMKFADDFFPRMQPEIARAFSEMAALEAGAVANPDEKRLVGHYWLRAPELAPDASLGRAITDARGAIAAFVADVHSGKVRGSGGAFEQLVIIGIGGSALGPQLVSSALASVSAKMRVFFVDNTDPDGIDLVIANLGARLDRTLSLVISKSGGTKETRNGMLEVRAAYEARGLAFEKHAVAVTGKGSELDGVAERQGWLARFPMWDWVGGRTSELSAVGLLPAALEGIDVDALCDGARAMDVLTREKDARKNPAALLALMWFSSGQGRGEKAMVVLPYKDRLSLVSRYLQQLVMESIGKERDLDGKIVHQGLTVYGNKGSTDQHAYVQQLRDGRNDFFATFIQVHRDRAGASVEVEPGVTSGDYLFGFLEGTRRALYENGRESMTLALETLDATRVGAIIALFERAVGLYASLIRINAYHQPGVEAGKKAAGEILSLRARVLGALKSAPLTVDQLADQLGASAERETIWKILEHAATNTPERVRRTAGSSRFSAHYFLG